ncbi:MAG: TlyA family RNA methyltransferase [Acidobacteria bacterium]|nr:TlyA family RNA methyltransferase [Acidobacteriota bacterium]
MRKPPSEKLRLDQLMVARGLAESRERSQALILAGRVEVEGKRAVKAGERVDSSVRLVLLGPDHPFVGRGGVKLAGSLSRFGIDPADRVALDVGASTGGFTDCLLQRGARRVYALDVGTGQLHERLRKDPKVVVLESINARYLKATDIPESVSLITVDVSFISLRLILPALVPLMSPGADLVTLVKPQFEVGRREVGKGGIVRDPRLHRRVINEILSFGASVGLTAANLCASPLPGTEGNREYFLHFRAGEPGGGVPSQLEQRLAEALLP